MHVPHVAAELLRLVQTHHALVVERRVTTDLLAQFSGASAPGLDSSNPLTQSIAHVFVLGPPSLKLVRVASDLRVLRVRYLQGAADEHHVVLLVVPLRRRRKQQRGLLLPRVVVLRILGDLIDVVEHHVVVAAVRQMKAHVEELPLVPGAVRRLLDHDDVEGHLDEVAHVGREIPQVPIASDALREGVAAAVLPEGHDDGEAVRRVGRRRGDLAVLVDFSAPFGELGE
mmetsp:Transcript_19311/g.62950  ORF Transcript_19311/g.62950 Transcript_19311/m.62950 type:complete len:228 (+) Transcript_19311:577-1260(+)